MHNVFNLILSVLPEVIGLSVFTIELLFFDQLMLLQGTLIKMVKRNKGTVKVRGKKGLRKTIELNNVNKNI